jgi:hypothetical protein
MDVVLRFVTTEPEVLDKGRCYRPILAVDRPIIAEIPMHTLRGRICGVMPRRGERGGVFLLIRDRGQVGFVWARGVGWF